jgi:hypothetical protein
MIQVYFILGGGALILGLWATIAILRSRAKRAELERDISRTLAEQAKKVINHDRVIQKKIKQDSVERDERISKKVSEDVKKHNFDDFYD